MFNRLPTSSQLRLNVGPPSGMSRQRYVAMPARTGPVITCRARPNSPELSHSRPGFAYFVHHVALLDPFEILSGSGIPEIEVHEKSAHRLHLRPRPSCLTGFCGTFHRCLQFRRPVDVGPASPNVDPAPDVCGTRSGTGLWCGIGFGEPGSAEPCTLIAHHGHC